MERSELQIKIIDNIRRYRLEKNMTQEELARRSNLQTGYIGGIETYQRFPKIDNLNQIAKGLGVDLALLISEDTNNKVTQVSEKIAELEKYIHLFLERNEIPSFSTVEKEKVRI
jgi:transcriptional regulator with XRE-family HTH domain